MNEKLETMIESAIENELKYKTDYITNKGWKFLEEKAKSLILEKIEEDDLDEDELDALTEDDIKNYLENVIEEYESYNAPIRTKELW